MTCLEMNTEYSSSENKTKQKTLLRSFLTGKVRITASEVGAETKQVHLVP